MRKFISFSFIAMMIIVANQATALANPILPSEDYFIEQNIEMQAVTEKLEDEEGYIINEEIDNDEDEIEEVDINDFKFVKLNKGFDNIENSTFEEFKDISAEECEGVNILVIVYHEEDEIIVTKSYNQTIGPSGLYSEKISLDYVGKNYILIITELDGEIYARQFIINRKDFSTKQQLETKLLNLTEGINVKEDNKQDDKMEESKGNITNIGTETEETIKGINEFSLVW